MFSFGHFVLFASVAALSFGKLFPEDEKELEVMWKDYRAKFGKTYTSQESELSHYHQFIKNLQHIDKLNEQSAALGGEEPAVFGLTQYTDKDVTALVSSAPAPQQVSEVENTSLRHRRLGICVWPLSYWGKQDWTSDDISTAVNNQESCAGGHWAFAVAEQVESDARLASSSFDYTLSPQQLIDCATTNFGCVSPALDDAMLNGFTYLQSRGLQTASRYPFSSVDGNDGSCSVSTSDEKVKVTAIKRELAGDECDMLWHLLNSGPLAVCLTVGANFYHYSGGYLDANSCSLPFDGNTDTTMICGQITKVRRQWGKTSYYKFRASKGPSWGDDGYAKLKMWENTCGVADMPMYTEVNIL